MTARKARRAAEQSTPAAAAPLVGADGLTNDLRQLVRSGTISAADARAMVTPVKAKSKKDAKKEAAQWVKNEVGDDLFVDFVSSSGPIFFVQTFTKGTRLVTTSKQSHATGIDPFRS